MIYKFLKRRVGILSLILFIVFIKTGYSQSQSTEAKIESVFSKMSIEEKVGQMTQINLNVILKGGYDNQEGVISADLLDIAITKYKVGSILNSINHAYSVEKWRDIVTTIQDKATKDYKGTKIPVIYGLDAIHGVTFTLESTLFPHNIGIAASRNPTIAKEGAKITAKELRASGVRWNFDPVFDLGKMPLWSRFPETYGEDPYIVEKMGVASVVGYEEDGLKSITSVASCMKHFIGYSASRTGRDRTPSYIPEIELREYYLPQFKAAIDAGASTIMINSGELNGIPVHGDKYLLTTVLRDELGFKGVVVTDWEDINRLHERHNVSPNLKEAIRTGVLAGIDMSMTPHDFKFAIIAAELYKEDPKFAARVDESVKRILKLKFDLGLFDNPYPEKEAFKNFKRPEYKEAALNAALQTMTLLKNNNNILPLSKKSKIVLAGPNANNVPSLHGSWSYTWQGADATFSWKANANNKTNGHINLFGNTKSVKDEFETMLGKENIKCQSVSNYEDPANYQLGSVSDADVIVLALGENSYAESPGAIQDLTIDKRQIELVKAAVKTGKPVVVVLIEGRGRLISEFADEVDGILLAYLPGSEGAKAITQTVFGDYNPGGKLPYTYHRNSGDFVTYDLKWTEMNVEKTPGNFTDEGYFPQFPFGHGLSYTTFEYSNFNLSSDVLTGDDNLTVTVDVKNTGTKKGDEVVELYIRDMYASVVPPLKRLKKFERIHLNVGETKTVRFNINKKDLQIATQDSETRAFAYVTEEGEFKVMINGFGFELEKPEGSTAPALSRTFKGAKSFVYKN